MADENGALPAAGLLCYCTAQEPGSNPENLCGMARGLAEPRVCVAVLIDLQMAVIRCEYQ